MKKIDKIRLTLMNMLFEANEKKMYLRKHNVKKSIMFFTILITFPGLFLQFFELFDLKKHE
jgi:hypothetical protein